MTQLSPEMKAAVREAARQAAEHATKKTLLSMGIDATRPAAIQEAQRDFLWLRRVRMAAESRSAKFLVGGISLAVTIVGGIVTFFVQRLLGGTKP